MEASPPYSIHGMAWFSGPGSSSRYSSRYSSTSHYRRRPRDGYINRIVHQIKRYIRELYGYARRHPLKVFMLLVMPLITGGALHNILKRFGIRLPAGMSRAMNNFGGGRGGFAGDRGGFSDLGGSGGVQNIMRIAQMFS